MRIAIIGATGMLGHHAALAAVARGHQVHVVHRASSKLAVLGDLTCTKSVADLDDADALVRGLEGVDAVINCGGYYPTLPRPWRAEVETARRQMENFYDACARHAMRKVVYVGGAIALPRRADGAPADESLSYSGSPANKNPYLQVKWALDAQALQRSADGLPVVIGIPSMTFGEFDAGPTTGRLIVEIANGTLPAYVRGNRNTIYAGDAGLGLVRVCEDGRPGERYLLTGENISMDDLVGRIAKIVGVPTPRAAPLAVAKFISSVQTLRFRTFGGDPPMVDATAIAVMSAGQFLSGAKAKAELGFEAKTPIDQAIRRAFEWFCANGYVKG